VDPRAVDALLARARREVDARRLESCQLAVALDGRLVVSGTFGRATDESRYVVFSITKALMAATVWLLVGEGLLAAETRVADVVPEFADNGKDAVTVEHLMTHTAGFPRAPMSPEEGATSAGRCRRFRAWRLDWEPGSRSEYHAASAHWVLAELVERVSGADYRDVVRDRVIAPLRLTGLQLGVPREQQSDVLDVHIVGADRPAREGLPPFAEPVHLLRYNEPVVREVGVPGVGAVARAGDIALLYQALLTNPGRLWDPAVLADGTGHVRTSLVDPLIGVPTLRTLGLRIAGDDGNAALREFGTGTSPAAFGAAGIGGQMAWADPATGLSFCYLTNGLEADVVTSFLRSNEIGTLAAACVPRAGPDDASECMA
jgi:CubicO group peptidase (beta-lactamase class C family)